MAGDKLALQMQIHVNALANNMTDYLTSIAKGVVGVCPLIGPIAAEAVGILIPQQRLDRVAAFLKALDAHVRMLDSNLEAFSRNARSTEGLEVLEDGLVQAGRSASTDRKERLAHLVARSLTRDELKYAETKKVLNLFRELTDPEIIWLLYYSLNPTLERGPHSELVEKHPEVLQPVSRAIGASQEQRDRAALQDSYKSTLARFGLVAQNDRTTQITALGRLVVRYVAEEEPS